MLNSQCPCGDIRRLVISVHRKDIAGTGIVTNVIAENDFLYQVGGIYRRAAYRRAVPIQLVRKKRNSGGNYVADTRSTDASNLNYRASGNNVGSQGDCIVRVLLGKKSAHRKQVIDDTRTRPDDSVPIPLYVPGYANTGREICGIFLVE